jgi:methionyl aminopeptidase
MVELKTPGEIQLMAEAGRLVAATLAEVERISQVGVSLLDLDEVAYSTITGAGARPTFLQYHPGFAPTPYPATICTSVNDVIVHGIPNRYRLCEGDLVSIDCAAHLAGYCADAAISYVVGRAAPAAEQLIAAATTALRAAIEAAQPGGRLGDISAAIGRVGRKFGYGIPPDFGGHGIGRAMHESPSVANTGRPGMGLRLEPGLVLALEPMFMAGGQDRYLVDPDGWALRTSDSSLAAHVEHTVAITEEGPAVLTTTEAR